MPLLNYTDFVVDQQQELSDEDKKILAEHHKNAANPDHPAHKDHPKHHEFLKSIPKKLGGAAIFGAVSLGNVVNVLAVCKITNFCRT